jgi:hypothetical protein
VALREGAKHVKTPRLDDHAFVILTKSVGIFQIRTCYITTKSPAIAAGQAVLTSLFRTDETAIGAALQTKLFDSLKYGLRMVLVTSYKLPS